MQDGTDIPPRRLTGAQRPVSASKSDLTRQRILDAAAIEFRDQGYAAARLSDIAARVGMQAGSLYYHFDSREALVEAVMHQGLERTHTALSARLAELSDADPLARIEAAIATHLELVLAQGATASAPIKLIWQVPPDIRERAIAAHRAYGALWRRLLEDARRAGAVRADIDLAVVRMAILGALNWAVDWYKPGRAGPARIARDIATMVVHGLAARD